MRHAKREARSLFFLGFLFVEWVRAVCARLGGKVVVVVVEAPTYLPMKGKKTKNNPQV